MDKICESCIGNLNIATYEKRNKLKGTKFLENQCYVWYFHCNLGHQIHCGGYNQWLFIYNCPHPWSIDLMNLLSINPSLLCLKFLGDWIWKKIRVIVVLLFARKKNTQHFKIEEMWRGAKFDTQSKILVFFVQYKMTTDSLIAKRMREMSAKAPTNFTM